MDLLIFKTKLKSLYPVSRDLVVADPLIASVIVLLFNFDNKVFVLMTRRSKQLKIHPGEMSFPGGRYEEEDGNLLNTALRETREEVGMNFDESQVSADSSNCANPYGLCNNSICYYFARASTSWRIE